MARATGVTVVHTGDGRHVWLRPGVDVPEELAGLVCEDLLDDAPASTPDGPGKPVVKRRPRKQD